MTARLSHGPAFWVVAVAFLATMAFSTIPTPLYAIYRERDGFATFMITVIFAAYAVGVAASLYLAGHLSDWFGRRVVMTAAIVIEIVAAIVFIAWPEVPGLIVARFVSGVGIGALTATATAHLAELHAVARPGEATRAAVISSFANIGGLSLGPLVAGILAQWVAAPLVVPYVIFIVVLVLAGCGIALVPETVERAEPLPRYRPQRVAVPPAARAEFAAAGLGAFAAFSVFGLTMALTPTVLGAMGQTSRFVAGVVVFASFMAAALAQVVTARWPGARQLVIALVLVIVGIAALAASSLLGVFALYVAAGIVVGAGVGMLFRSSLGVAASLAPAGARGEVLAASFLISYVGLAVPSLAIGLALVWVPLTTVIPIFAGLVVVLVAIAVPRMLGTVGGNTRDRRVVQVDANA